MKDPRLGLYSGDRPRWFWLSYTAGRLPKIVVHLTTVPQAELDLRHKGGKIPPLVLFLPKIGTPPKLEREYPWDTMDGDLDPLKIQMDYIWEVSGRAGSLIDALSDHSLELSYSSSKSDERILQAFTFRTFRAEGGTPLEGWLSPALVKWLGSATSEDEDSVQDAMAQAHHCMAGFGKRSKSREQGEFRARFFSNKRSALILSCPGNACDIACYPDLNADSSPRKGHQFGCHNLDTPIQALTLLAGLARLNDLFVKSEFAIASRSAA